MIADAFSDDLRRQFAERNVKIGSVIKVHVADTNPPKEKRLILVGISYDKVLFASIFLNSELNMNVFPTPELRDLNIELTCDSRQYLDHDSFADCSEIRKRKADWLLDIVTHHPERVLGELDKDDLKRIQAKIKSAPTISPALKKTFGLFF